LIRKVARIGEQPHADHHRRHRLGKSRAAVVPQRNERREASRIASVESASAAPKVNQHGDDLQQIRTLDDDGERRRREREHGKPARPHG